MFGDGGIVLPMTSKPVRVCLQSLRDYQSSEKHHWTPVYREKNVYKLHMQVPGGPKCEEFSLDPEADLQPVDGDDEAMAPFQGQHLA